jgi:peroxiredoxin
VLAVNAWRDSLADCQAFRKKHGLTFPVLVDEEGSVARQYGVTFVPYLVLIDPQGHIQFAGRSLDEMAQKLAQLVGN